MLVLFFAPTDFSLGTPVFPSPQKPKFPNSHSTRNQVDEEPLCGCATSKSLLFFYLNLSAVTVEPWCHKGTMDWQNLFAMVYIKVISHIFYYYLGLENRLLYCGLLEVIIEVRYIKVPLYGIKIICKIPLVVYYQCCVLIGWTTTRLYVIVH